MDRLPRADHAIGFLAPASIGGLDRRDGRFRRFLRGFIHFFSYHLILARRSTRVTRAAGFRLEVRPTVFHPRYFISSECFGAPTGIRIRVNRPGMRMFFALSNTARTIRVPVDGSTPVSTKSRWPSCGVPFSLASPA